MFTTLFTKESRQAEFDPCREESSDLESLNTLLRGELSAVETYALAIEKAAGQTFESELRRIHSDHLDAAGLLRDRIWIFDGVTSESSGIWGNFAAAVANTAKVFGMKALLAVLKQGEEHGISDYQKALNKATLSHGCVNLIDGLLIPRCRYHVSELNRLAERVE